MVALLPPLLVFSLFPYNWKYMVSTQTKVLSTWAVSYFSIVLFCIESYRGVSAVFK